MALAEFQQLVNDMVRDQSSMLTPDVRDRAIEQARVRYSADCERELVEDVVWTAAGFYGPLPVGWLPGAYVRQAEYPVGQQPPRQIELGVYQHPGGQSLFADPALPVGSVVRVTFGAPHALAGGTTPADTIPAWHRLPVASLAASLLCQQLATYYSGQRETALGADVSQTETRAREFAARAKEYRAAYYVGTRQADPYARAGTATTVSGAAPAGVVGAWPGRPRNSLTRGVL